MPRRCMWSTTARPTVLTTVFTPYLPPAICFTEDMLSDSLFEWLADLTRASHRFGSSA